MLGQVLRALVGRCERGSVASEYAVLIAVVTVALVTAMANLSGAVTGVVNLAAQAIN